MADRVSKLWRATKQDIAEDHLDDIEKIKVTTDNLTMILMRLHKDDINYDLMMNIFGSFEDKVLCHPYDRLEVPVGAFKYCTVKDKTSDSKIYKSNKNIFTTTIGLWIFNIYLRDFNFSRFFDGYFQETINSGNFGDIEQKLSYALIEDQITTEDLKQWENTMQWLMPFETILTPNHTEKMLTATEVIDKKKKELLAKYKDKLEAGDPAAAEAMEKELLAYAKDYLGDDPSVDTLDSGALGDWGNNFKNMYIMKGAVRNPDPNAKQRYNIVTGNYMDGIPANEYSIIAGGAAQGAYSRGKKTENGGYFEKLFTYAYSFLQLDPPGSDCGTKKTITVDLTSKNIDDYMYSYIVLPSGKLELLDSTNREKYIGKTVKMRFSALCESTTGICNKCAGELFYKLDNPRVGLVLSSIPDTMKLRSMKGFHDSTVKTVKIKPYEAFFPFEDQ